MKIQLSKSKGKDKWIIKMYIPVKQRESNCYMDEKDLQDVDNICGMVDGHDYGFTKVINMSYAGKPDQYTSIFLDCGMFMSKKEFENMCQSKGMDIVYIN